ncbi:hypothetical protein MCOR25_010586 [Pyricularia grisea]|nr:hypothetical protein MCOR25_010586 [Pyricularia grisea]
MAKFRRLMLLLATADHHRASTAPKNHVAWATRTCLFVYLSDWKCLYLGRNLDGSALGKPQCLKSKGWKIRRLPYRREVLSLEKRKIQIPIANNHQIQDYG